MMPSILAEVQCTVHERQQARPTAVHKTGGHQITWTCTCKLQIDTIRMHLSHANEFYPYSLWAR